MGKNWQHAAKKVEKLRKKADLPTKICPVCQRPFAWRRKWAKEWANVIYCSERCRKNKIRQRQ